MNKSVLVYLSLLSLLVVCDAWFLNLKSDKSDKVAQTTPSPKTRKVILVARKVYVPMYASDDTSTADMSGRLLPVSPVLATSGAAMEIPRQQPVDYSSMYYQPPIAAYAMPGSVSAGASAAYSAPSAYAAYAAPFPVPVPVNADAPLQQYAIYPGGYGDAIPQYVQYGNAPVPETWMLPYGGSETVTAGLYSPTGTEGETVTQDLAPMTQQSEAEPSV